MSDSSQSEADFLAEKVGKFAEKNARLQAANAALVRAIRAEKASHRYAWADCGEKQEPYEALLRSFGWNPEGNELLNEFVDRITDEALAMARGTEGGGA
jgi:hypothetical protein